MTTIVTFLFVILITVGSVESGCGCKSWCRKNGKQYGICGDGHTCICSSSPITDAEQGCGCAQWCRKAGHSGGICGDGHTCICSQTTEIKKNDEHVRGQYKLTIINNIGQDFTEQMRKSLVDTYFQVYPKLQSRFNRNALKHVSLKIDPNYEGIAYASNGEIVFSGKHLKEHPIATGVFTHELMHIVQSYPSGQPGWLVEGIADYVRYKYAEENGPNGWQLPNFDASQRYTDSSRVTARFLVWLEKKIQKNIVNVLDQTLRRNQYQNGQVWSQTTGKSVDQLWKEYTNNPSL